MCYQNTIYVIIPQTKRKQYLPIVLNMYPSIKHALVEKAVDYFIATLNIDESTTIKERLEMIKFAMSSNILNFRGNHYEYDGAVEINEMHFTMGGFESI